MKIKYFNSNLVRSHIQHVDISSSFFLATPTTTNHGDRKSVTSCLSYNFTGTEVFIRIYQRKQ